MCFASDSRRSRSSLVKVNLQGRLVFIRDPPVAKYLSTCTLESLATVALSKRCPSPVAEKRSDEGRQQHSLLAGPVDARVRLTHQHSYGLHSKKATLPSINGSSRSRE